MFTILFTIIAHGTLTGKRAVLFVVVVGLTCAVIFFLDKWCDKGANIENFLDRRMKSGKKVVDVIAFAVIVFVALVVRICFIDFETEDSIGFFAYWVEQFRGLGIKTSLGANITDYSPLYTTILTLLSLLPLKALTVVKIVPIVCDFLIALAAVYVYNEIKGNDATSIGRACMAFFVLLNPVSVLNSAAWGQCDSTYAVSLFFGIYFLSKVKAEGGKYSELAVVMFALSFATKFQAILVIPVLLFFYVAQRRKEPDKGIRLSQFIWFPIVYFAPSIPMLLCGKTIENIVMVYAKETGEYNNTLTMRYYNFYSLLGDKIKDSNFDGYFMYGMIIAVMLLFVLYFLVYKKELELNLYNLLLISSLTVLTLSYFLPSMHERYAFVGEIALVMLACLNKKLIVPAVMTVTCTLSAYGDYLTEGMLGSTIPAFLVAIIRLIVIVYLSHLLLNNNKKLLENDCL